VIRSRQNKAVSHASGRRIVSAVSFVGDEARQRHADLLLGGGNDRNQIVAAFADAPHLGCVQAVDFRPALPPFCVGSICQKSTPSVFRQSRLLNRQQNPLQIKLFSIVHAPRSYRTAFSITKPQGKG
jgi:hypothetical protein